MKEIAAELGVSPKTVEYHRARLYQVFRVREGRLKAGLEVFGCDPKVFTYSQPVRGRGGRGNCRG